MVHAKVLREPELEAYGDEDDARVFVVIEEAVYVTVFAYPAFRPLQAPQFEKPSKDKARAAACRGCLQHALRCAQRCLICNTY